MSVGGVKLEKGRFLHGELAMLLGLVSLLLGPAALVTGPASVVLAVLELRQERGQIPRRRWPAFAGAILGGGIALVWLGVILAAFA
jgi:uncharacterized membrane protein AbrB (regulator of aidB expression)